MSPRARRDVHHRGFDRHHVASFFSTFIVSRNTRTSLVENHVENQVLSPRVSSQPSRVSPSRPPSHRGDDGNDGDDDDGDDGDDDATLETEDATRRERSRVGGCVSNAAIDRTTARATDRALERATRGVMTWLGMNGRDDVCARG
jgi:hypothetical protein